MKVNRKIVGRRKRLLNALDTAQKMGYEDASDQQHINTMIQQIKQYILDNPDEYISLADNLAHISYAPFLENKYNEKARVRLKPLRFFRRKVGLKTSETTREKVLSRLHTALNLFDYSITKEIAKHYKIGYGGCSCMTGVHPGHQKSIIHFYEKNPSKVKLLTVQYGDYRGRALVWKSEDGTVYIDRVYTSSAIIREWIRNWAHRNNFGSFARNQSFSQKNRTPVVVIMKDYYGLCTNGKIHFPYLDSFAKVKPGGDKYRLLKEYIPNSSVLLHNNLSVERIKGVLEK